MWSDVHKRPRIFLTTEKETRHIMSNEYSHPRMDLSDASISRDEYSFPRLDKSSISVGEYSLSRMEGLSIRSDEYSPTLMDGGEDPVVRIFAIPDVASDFISFHEYTERMIRDAMMIPFDEYSWSVDFRPKLSYSQIKSQQQHQSATEHRLED